MWELDIRDRDLARQSRMHCKIKVYDMGSFAEVHSLLQGYENNSLVSFFKNVVVVVITPPLLPDRGSARTSI